MGNMEHHLDCLNCHRDVKVTWQTKKKRYTSYLCRECRRYVKTLGGSKPERAIGRGFLESITHPRTMRYGKNGRPLARADVKPLAIGGSVHGGEVVESNKE